ncbi:MAG TPA: hypothetical protein VFU04_01025, partial [Solirubrobacterales bacterium]|nr:hypothetical protein [Solirubrobacterales bacterium]
MRGKKAIERIRWTAVLGLVILGTASGAGSAQACTSKFLLKAGGTGSGAGQLSAPGDIATDSSGNVWVLDTSHNRVQKFNSS